MGFNIEKFHIRNNTVSRTDTVKFIVVHYVGDGNSSAGSARRNCVYFDGGYRGASAHYFIDDEYIYEAADPRTRATWHCGDGHGKYGITNQNSIGIEVCNNGGPYTDAEIARLAWLVQKLMHDFGVPASHVVRHYDASRKECPLYYVENPSAWAKLQAQITGNAALDGGSTPSNALAVDGYWGNDTTLALQKYFGTPQDGIVSSQDVGWKPRNAGLTGGWEWVRNAGQGSQLMCTIQAALGVTVDGLFGPKTANALITRYANETGCIQDGKLDAESATIKAMQRHLNAGTF